MRARRRRRPDVADRGHWSAAALDAAADGILAIDEHGRITRANAAAGRLLGRPVDELVGADAHEALPLLGGDGELYPRSRSPVRGCFDADAAPRTQPELILRPGGPALGVELFTAPVRDGRRTVGGLVSFRPVTSPAGHDYSDEVLRITERERAQREFLQQLQEAVRPREPVVDNVDLGVHYLPADPNAPSGGDLYDWQLLPDGDLHIVVVDVIGSGVSATKDALAVVHAVRVLALEGCPIDQLVARADTLLVGGHPGLVATLLIARYTPSTGRMVVAGGGHPPMLVVSADGEVREVVAPGIAVGWPGAGSFEVAEIELDRSEMALFYTDGLIEARRDILAGLSDLKAAVAETATYPARHLPRVLVERALEGAERRDDTLALVLRRRAAPAGPPARLLDRFDHRFSPHLAAVPVARHLFDEWLSQQGVEDVERQDLQVVVSELCTNAVRSAGGRRSSLRLRARPDADALVIEVDDDGAGFDVALPSVDDVPPVEKLSGRGLFIVQSLVDQFDVSHTETGTTVRCTKRHLFATPVARAAR
ncbi:MAG: SpoIIE family protein phosphatase [Actinobacteria bacterium]|nr:SpoIIE family protein phosphatase [Actinomycetota bacterium]